jgi:hypothetical protein
MATAITPTIRPRPKTAGPGSDPKNSAPPDGDDIADGRNSNADRSGSDSATAALMIGHNCMDY